jgi:hypothetical protein
MYPTPAKELARFDTVYYERNFDEWKATEPGIENKLTMYTCSKSLPKSSSHASPSRVSFIEDCRSGHVIDVYQVGRSRFISSYSPNRWSIPKGPYQHARAEVGKMGNLYGVMET